MRRYKNDKRKNFRKLKRQNAKNLRTVCKVMKYVGTGKVLVATILAAPSIAIKLLAVYNAIVYGGACLVLEYEADKEDKSADNDNEQEVIEFQQQIKNLQSDGTGSSSAVEVPPNPSSSPNPTSTSPEITIPNESPLFNPVIVPIPVKPKPIHPLTEPSAIC